MDTNTFIDELEFLNDNDWEDGELAEIMRGPDVPESTDWYQPNIGGEVDGESEEDVEEIWYI